MDAAHVLKLVGKKQQIVGRLPPIMVVGREREQSVARTRRDVEATRTGVTGAKDSLPDDLPALVRRARAHTNLPIAVGFGISLPGHVSVLGGLADAAAIGSALVSEIENAKSVDAAAEALANRIRSLKQAASHGLSRREVAP